MQAVCMRLLVGCVLEVSGREVEHVEVLPALKAPLVGDVVPVTVGADHLGSSEPRFRASPTALAPRPPPLSPAIAAGSQPRALGSPCETMIDALLHRIGLDRAARGDVDGLRELHRAYLARVPYEDLAVQLGETGPLDEAALAARLLADGRGGYCFELNTVLAALLRGCGFVVTHHQAVVGGEGPTNHMALLVDLDGERWLADAGLGEGFLDPLPFREGATQIGPFTYTLAARGRRVVVDGPARVGLGPRVPHDRGGVAGGGLRGPPPAAGDGPRVHLRPDARGPEPRPDRIVTLRARTLSDGRPGGRLRSGCSSARSSRPCCATSSGSRSAASGSSACGRGRRPARSLPGARLMQVATHPGTFTPTTSSPSRCWPRPRPLELVRTRDDARSRRPTCASTSAGAGPRDRRLRPPPARRGRRARQRHPLRELRPRLARVRRAVAGGEDAATAIDQRLVQGVDANDTGQTSRPRSSRASGR